LFQHEADHSPTPNAKIKALFALPHKFHAIVPKHEASSNIFTLSILYANTKQKLQTADSSDVSYTFEIRSQ
jgi:hypothetical protein